MKVLVTGTAGFIGAALAQQLLARGDQVIGIDNLNNYYDVQLKQARLDLLTCQPGFTEVRIGLEDKHAVDQAFKTHSPDRVVNLAAQAGVRHSLSNPQAYIDSNITGFLNILEACRHFGTEHLVYASSSSVYGANTRMPYAEQHIADHPVSLYAATKKSNELMAHTYSHLFKIRCTGLRFFTVYGPWGRPDMAPMVFADKIARGDAIDVFNHGNHRRDFTYIDDVIAGIITSLDNPAQPNSNWMSHNPDPSSSSAPYRIYNIGSNKPIELLYFIELIEQGLGKAAVKNLLPMQPGDVSETYAKVDSLTNATAYKPQISIETGVARFIDWYRTYYKIR